MHLSKKNFQILLLCDVGDTHLHVRCFRVFLFSFVFSVFRDAADLVNPLGVVVAQRLDEIVDLDASLATLF